MKLGKREQERILKTYQDFIAYAENKQNDLYGRCRALGVITGITAVLGKDALPSDLVERHENIHKALKEEKGTII